MNANQKEKLQNEIQGLRPAEEQPEVALDDLGDICHTDGA
jgi:hypothetical protein